MRERSTLCFGCPWGRRPAGFRLVILRHFRASESGVTGLWPKPGGPMGACSMFKTRSAAPHIVGVPAVVSTFYFYLLQPCNRFLNHPPTTSLLFTSPFFILTNVSFSFCLDSEPLPRPITRPPLRLLSSTPSLINTFPLERLRATRPSLNLPLYHPLLNEPKKRVLSSVTFPVRSL